MKECKKHQPRISFQKKSWTPLKRTLNIFLTGVVLTLLTIGHSSDAASSFFLFLHGSACSFFSNT